LHLRRIYDGIICSDNQRVFQESFLTAIQMDICSEIEWYKVAHLSHPHARTFIDVGANKGYLAALFISLWGGGESGLNPLSVHDHAAEAKIWEGSRNPYGFCKDGMNMGLALYCHAERDGEGVCQDHNDDVVVYSIDGSGVLTEAMNNLISSSILPAVHKKLGRAPPVPPGFGTLKKAPPVSQADNKVQNPPTLKTDINPDVAKLNAATKETSPASSKTVADKRLFTKASTADDDTLPIKFKPTKVDYLLKSTSRRLASQRGRQDEVWRYYNYAVSDSVGTTQFTKQGKGSKVGPGFEGGKMGAKETAGYEIEVVNMTTIEKFVSDNNIERLDMLKIDAEGYDNKVLQVIEKIITLNKFLQFYKC